MKSNQDLLARLEARIETNREEYREDLKGMVEEMNAKAGGKQEEILARMRKDIKSSQAEIRSAICAMLSELESIQREMRAVIQPVRSELDETTACSKATKTEPDS
jgi:vacuolar-type H+-ATPase subunit E/Vma4